jgi:2-dehydropantoate 2-reductase
LWAKLVANCAYNAVSAISQLPYGVMIESPGVRELMRDVTAEVVAVAKADGIRMLPDLLERVYGIAKAMPTQKSSTAQDLARGKPTEIDHLNGYIVRRGEALGIATPANRALWALVKLLEGKSKR